MSDSADELLSRADALLSRWRGGLPPVQPTADYPVLTEVVESPAQGESRADRPRPTHEPTVAAAQPSAAQISALEMRVWQRVLDAIEPTIGGMVANSIQGRLGETSRRLTSELTGQVSEDISELVRDAVRRALELELVRLRAESPGRKHENLSR